MDESSPPQGMQLPDWMPATDPVRARFSELYGELSRIAHRELGGNARTSLDTVGLVNEAFMKLDGKGMDASEKGPFLALAAKAMRQVLVDHVRSRLTAKRGSGARPVTLTTRLPLDEATGDIDLLDIEASLQALQQLEPRLVDVVEMRFFGGMEQAEIAAVLGVSERTVHRDWLRARAFLQARLER